MRSSLTSLSASCLGGEVGKSEEVRGAGWKKRRGGGVVLVEQLNEPIQVGDVGRYQYGGREGDELVK